MDGSVAIVAQSGPGGSSIFFHVIPASLLTYAHNVDGARSSFAPAMRLFGFVGSIAIVGSVWSRSDERVTLTFGNGQFGNSIGMDIARKCRDLTGLPRSHVAGVTESHCALTECAKRTSRTRGDQNFIRSYWGKSACNSSPRLPAASAIMSFMRAFGPVRYGAKIQPSRSNSRPAPSYA